MNNDIHAWPKSEKILAQKILGVALNREMLEIRKRISKTVTDYKEHEDIWKLHKYLSDKKKEMDSKYELKYSQMILVFGRMIREGYLREDDFNGLSESKIKAVKEISVIPF
jgi:hypothetical protein